MERTTLQKFPKSGEIKVQNRMITPKSQSYQYPLSRNNESELYFGFKCIRETHQKNKALPSFPSNDELQRSGIDVASFQMKLLKEIEELTLIIIDQNKRIESMKKDIKK
jgi:hypothetical protein